MSLNYTLPGGVKWTLVIKPARFGGYWTRLQSGDRIVASPLAMLLVGKRAHWWAPTVSRALDISGRALDEVRGES